MAFISAQSEQSLKSEGGGIAKPCTGYPTTAATIRITIINSLTNASHSPSRPTPDRKTTLKIFPASAEDNLGGYVPCSCFTGSKMG